MVETKTDKKKWREENKYRYIERERRERQRERRKEAGEKGEM